MLVKPTGPWKQLHLQSSGFGNNWTMKKWVWSQLDLSATGLGSILTQNQLHWMETSVGEQWDLSVTGLQINRMWKSPASKTSGIGRNFVGKATGLVRNSACEQLDLKTSGFGKNWTLQKLVLEQLNLQASGAEILFGMRRSVCNWNQKQLDFNVTALANIWKRSWFGWGATELDRKCTQNQLELRTTGHNDNRTQKHLNFEKCWWNQLDHRNNCTWNYLDLETSGPWKNG